MSRDLRYVLEGEELVCKWLKLPFSLCLLDWHKIKLWQKYIFRNAHDNSRKKLFYSAVLFLLAYNRTLPDLSPSYSSVTYFSLGVEKLSQGTMGV